MSTGRAAEAAVAVLALATFATWFAALLQSMPPPPPALVVQGEPLVPTGNPLALRITAARPNAAARSRVDGVVTSGSERAVVQDGVARLPRVAGPVHAELRVDGELDADVDLNVAEARISLGPPKLMFSSWSAEVQTFDPATPREQRRVPLYPVDGRVSGRLPSRVLVLADADDGGPRVVEVTPQVQGARLDDGRVLAVDRSGLRLEAPLEVDAGGVVEVTVQTAEPREVGLDLVVDGAVQDTAIARTTGASLATRVTLRMGPARPGDVVVVHAGGVWPDELGRFQVARVRDPDVALAAWVQALVTRAGAPDREPLLDWLGKSAALGGAPPAVTDDALRAALGRLKPAKLRAPRLVVTPAEATPLGTTLRLVYAGLAGVLVLAVLALGLVRLPGRRAAVALATLAVGLLVAGLYAALVIASGSAR